ncbi:MAG TPA: LPS assembly lipoprotein LptE [Geminicoccaceae bacterium]|nr:LPS assembly lipoprotein LptE [Geminicoccaceae bacterium]
MCAQQTTDREIAGPPAAPPRRRALLLALLLTAAAGLGGCGCRPIYGRDPEMAAAGAPGDRPVRAEMAAVRVVGLNDRLGQALYNDLLDELNPAGIEVSPRYDLVVRTSRGTQALAIQLDNQITRYNLTLAAAFQLRRRADNRPLYRSTVRRVASYNVRREPFATLIAEQDAERRAAREVSEDIGRQLAVLFARGFDDGEAPAAPGPEPTPGLQPAPDPLDLFEPEEEGP